jgi:hypothetical protein
MTWRTNMGKWRSALLEIATSLSKVGVRVDTDEIRVSGAPWWRTSLFCYGGEQYEIEIRDGGRKDLLVHEIGHYLIIKYELDRCALYRKVFGYYPPASELRDSFLWVLGYLDVRVRGYPNMYATIDGEEHFCELLRLMFRTGWRAKHRDAVVEQRMADVVNILNWIATRESA